MGTSLSDALPGEAISQNTQVQLERRFIVSPHPVYLSNPEFKLLHERLTARKFILRVLTVADQHERNKLETRIFKQLAHRNEHLPKLEHYLFQDFRGYCGTVTKCYLFFELGDFTTFREEILKQAIQRPPFNETQLLKGLQNLIYGLLWLRYLREQHENVNTLNIFYTGGTMVLGDPLICPVSHENPERYISPEKQLKIDGNIENYDPYVSDVFGIAMCILEAVRFGRLDKMYKRNGKLNTEMLIEEVNKCQYQQLRNVLQRLLVSANNTDHRQQFLQIYGQRFKQKINNQIINQKPVKMPNGGIRRLKGKGSVQEHRFITTKEVNGVQHNKNESKLQKEIYEIKQETLSPKPIVQYINKPASTDEQHRTQFRFIHPPNLPLHPHIDNRIPSHNIAFNVDPPKQYNNIVFSKLDPVTIPNYQNDISKTYSAWKFVPVHDYLISPSFHPKWISQNSIKKDPLPLSHQKSKQQLAKPLFHIPSTTSITENASKNIQFKYNGDFEYKQKLENSYSAGKLFKNNQNSIDTSFPKIISPIKKYSENQIFQKYLNSYDKRQKEQRQKTELEKEKENGIQQEVKQKKKTEEIKETPHLQKQSEEPPSSRQQSSNNSDYANIIDQNFSKLEQGVSDAIERSIKSLQNKPITDFANSQVQKPLQTQPSNEVIESNPQAMQLQCMPLMKSQIFNQISEVTSQVQENSEDESIRIYSIQMPNLQNSEDNIVKTSITQEQSYVENKEQVEGVEPPRTPIRPYNTNLEAQNNRTIPQQDPMEEQSIDEGLSLPPQGQYRELQYQNGGRYCGFILNNQRHGEGTFHYKDGGYYQGQWKQNAMNGYGKLFYDDGSIAYEGQWYRDQFHGRGKVYNDSAEQLFTPFNYKTFQNYQCYWKMYEGDLSHDLKQGYGKLMLSNNEYYIGKFRNDKPEGEGHFHTKDAIVHGIWSNGKLVKQF